MPGSDDHLTSTQASAGYFATTHWTVIVHARQGDSPQARAALEQLCRTYWYPLYAYVRRQGHGPHDAQDLTQAFFETFLEKNYLDDVRHERGKFRSFLLVALKHFLANEWDKAQAQKRGGGKLVPLDDSAETRYIREPRDELTAEKIFERRWALTLLEQVLSRLREEFVADGKTAQFDCLKVFLSAGKGAVPYAQVAVELEMSEGAVKTAVHRLRQRYRELLRAEIAHTVFSPGEIDGEIRHLFAALSR
ncbi:MAG TPA: RNA polymerase sigma factor [Verrucomicrobiae bacterium]|jgi:RNA polymerase sigma-70 factor (ECF subfamily)